MVGVQMMAYLSLGDRFLRPSATSGEMESMISFVYRRVCYSAWRIVILLLKPFEKRVCTDHLTSLRGGTARSVGGSAVGFSLQHSTTPESLQPLVCYATRIANPPSHPTRTPKKATRPLPLLLTAPCIPPACCRACVVDHSPRRHERHSEPPWWW